jgi:hypothetical protein
MANKTCYGHFPGVIGWVALPAPEPWGCTLRWCRGEPVAYVLRGQRVGDHGMAEVLAEVPVSGRGWVDLAEVRTQGEAWLRGLAAPAGRAR